MKSNLIIEHLLKENERPDRGLGINSDDRSFIDKYYKFKVEPTCFLCTHNGGGCFDTFVCEIARRVRK